MEMNRRIVLRARPQGLPRATDFELVNSPVPEPAAGEMLVRVLYCSLDPAVRRWMDEDSYGTAIPLGGAIACLVVGRVVRSHCEGFEAGDYITGLGSVSDYALMKPGGFTWKIDPAAAPSLTNHLSVLGANGLTAYNGLLHVGKPNPGETVLVSGGAGAVGSLVGQIAKIQGCRAVGIAGGEAKCRLMRETFGFDAAVDYKGKDLEQLTADVRQACPSGVDVYFDNVGGLPLDAALAVINQNARLVICGMISRYNEAVPPPGPRNIWQLVAKTATMHGFLNRYYMAHFEEGRRNLQQWVREGRIKWREHVDEGIENFHRSFLRLFDGSNEGKLILKIADSD